MSVIAIARSYQAIEQGVRPQLAGQGLGLTEFAVLEVLYHKGALPLGKIRDRILVTGASTTYVVKKLEKRGLIGIDSFAAILPDPAAGRPPSATDRMADLLDEIEVADPGASVPGVRHARPDRQRACRTRRGSGLLRGGVSAVRARARDYSGSASMRWALSGRPRRMRWMPSSLAGYT